MRGLLTTIRPEDRLRFLTCVERMARVRDVSYARTPDGTCTVSWKLDGIPQIETFKRERDALHFADWLDTGHLVSELANRS